MDIKLFELPPFEGQQPRAGRLNLTGSTTTPVRPLKRHEEIIVVARAEVVGVNHEDVAVGKTRLLARIHKLNLLEVHELPQGEEELERGRQFSRAVSDVQAGEPPLFDSVEDLEDGTDG